MLFGPVYAVVCHFVLLMMLYAAVWIFTFHIFCFRNRYLMVKLLCHIEIIEINCLPKRAYQKISKDRQWHGGWTHIIN